MAIIKFCPQKISDFYLGYVVYNELVVEKSASEGCWFAGTHWNHNSIVHFDCVIGVWSSPSHALG